MKKNLILMMAMMLSSLTFSQVGINTTNPASTLDVTAKNSTGKASGVDGLLVPRVDRERAQNMASVPTSTLIYINSIATGTQVGIAVNIDAVGYYYFDGTAWAKLNPNSGSNVNIYTSDGTLQGNRIVTQNDKTLAFTGTKSNAFSVDDNTFSVDAANDRVGIGTITPQNKLDLGTSHGGNSTTDVTGKKLAVYNAADGSDFYGLGINSGTLQFHAASTKTEAPGMILNSAGNVGIGTDVPSSSAILELNNTSKGFLTTRMTTAQRDAITPKPEGLMIYNLDIHCLQYWNATQWIGNCSNNNNGVATITDCSSGTLSGTYQQGIAMNSTNTKVLTVNVTQIGAWSLSSNTVNGVSWSGSGIFTTTGSQTITVTASGTPTASGSFSYIYNIGGNTCTGSITFAPSGGVATITDCTTGALNGTYQQGTAMNGTNEWFPITVNVTQLGAYSVTSNTVNGVTWSYSGTFTSLGTQTAYARASGTPIAAGTFSYTFNLGSSTCSRNITFASGGGVATITDCSGALNGTYQQGTAMNNNNWFSINVNVTQLGPWSISSNTANGVSWSYSGTFTTLGPQTVYAVASGTPVSNGTFNYTFNLGGSICSRNVTFASSTGVATITNCTSGALNGTYQQGTAMNSNNYFPITVNVTQLGPWSISSNTANGVSWSYSGTFTSLGSQTVYAVASGTPTTSGSFNYTINLGGSTCVRNITYTSSGSTLCKIGPSDLPGDFAIDGQTVHMSVTHNGGYNWGTVTTACSGTGPNLPSSWALGRNSNNSANQGTTTTITFSKPIRNVVIRLVELNRGQSVTFSASGASISSAYECDNAAYSISGNTVTANPPGSGALNQRNRSLGIRVSSSTYFTTLTLTHNGLTNALGGTVQPNQPGTAMQVEVCNADVQ